MKKLPEGWERIDFLDTIERKSSFNHLKIKQQDYQEAGEFPIIDQGDNVIAGYTDNPDKVYKGDLPVVIFGDHTRVFKYVDYPFSLGADGAKVLVPDKKQFECKYFYYALRSLIITSQGYSRHYKFLKEKSLVKPSLPTQRRTVVILEKAEQVKNWHTEQSRLLDDYLQSVFLEMFGDPGINPNRWKEKKIGEICKTSSGGTPSRTNTDYYNGTIPWVKSGELNQGVIWDTEEKISEAALNESSAKYVEKDTILIAMYGATVGKTALLKIRATTNQAVCALSPIENNVINNIYFLYCLRFLSHYLIDQSVGGGQPNISQQIIRKTNIPLPPIDLQNKFAAIVLQVEKVKAQHEESSRQADDLFNALMQKTFTGELVA